LHCLTNNDSVAIFPELIGMAASFEDQCIFIIFSAMTFNNPRTVIGDSISVKMPGPGGEAKEIILNRLHEIIKYSE